MSRRAHSVISCDVKIEHHSCLIDFLNAKIVDYEIKSALLVIVATFFTAGFTAAQLDQVDLPIDVASTIDYTVTDFGVMLSEMVADPENPNNSCIKSVKSTGAASWAGTTVFTPDVLASFIPVTNEFATVTIRVYTPSAGIPILFKIENANNATWVCETLYSYTSGWQWMEFDLTNEAPGTPTHWQWD